MIATFDIFKTDAHGPRWIGTAVTLDEAQARVQSLGESDPGEYLIVSQKTGHRLRMRPETQRKQQPQ